MKIEGIATSIFIVALVVDKSLVKNLRRNRRVCIDMAECSAYLWCKKISKLI